MKTLDYLKELTGIDLTKERSNDYIFCELKEMLDLYRPIKDEEAYEFISSLSFIKRTIDKSNDDDFLFDHWDIYYAEKNEYKIIICCIFLKTGSSCSYFRWSNDSFEWVEGEVKRILKHHNLDMTKEYYESSKEQGNSNIER